MNGDGAASGEVPTPGDSDDEELRRIVAEEERVLERVLRTVRQDRRKVRGALIDYDAELIALRDQIRDARKEDLPPLIEEMERLQQVAQRRALVTEGIVDPQSPYFGRLVLEEGDRKREVLIGRSTFVDAKTGVRIVDWRDAPISRIYYRYEEGDDYDEHFGDRDVEGEVLVRRSLSVSMGRLRRVVASQGTFRRRADGTWQRAGRSATRLEGGQGAAMRPGDYHRPGQLGGGGLDREDKHLAEITALIDPRQFELITQPTSGLVVIQGGAGSGKTTIGLHRLAYLAFQDRVRFQPERMLVVVFNDALVRYIDRVLPSLGVEGVQVVTYERWAARARRRLHGDLPRDYSQDTPADAARLKKHPAIFHLLERRTATLADEAAARVRAAAGPRDGGGRALAFFRSTEGEAPAIRLRELRRWLAADGHDLPAGTRHALERAVRRGLEQVGDVPAVWAELLTDRGAIVAALEAHAREGAGEPGAGADAFAQEELASALAWCARQCTAALGHRERSREAADDEAGGEERLRGVDGQDEEELATLDREDDALLLRLHQGLLGPLRGKRAPLRYEHVFVDEVQDLSPVELSVVLDTVSDQQSVTLAGDVAQRLHLDNGFTSWRAVLRDLGLDHVEVEPLRLSYRSTYEILELANEVLGPLRNDVAGEATRHGAPVELFRFGSSGEAVAFLSEALRALAGAEPLASVAVLARYPEQADVYYKGLRYGEVPYLRRVARQDFSFRPGVDVTDVRQVKGLEFDYVVLVDCNTATYPVDDESRHLLHIAATRAAHQLWVLTTGSPSVLLPATLREQAG